MTMCFIAASLFLPAVQSIEEPGHELDFWLGEWALDSITPKEDGTLGEVDKDHGTNTIQREMKDKVIHERFDSPTFKGESWSVYNARTKKWHQTWVDDQGGYLTLEGGMEGSEFVLRQTHPTTTMRMRFSGIQKDSFTWSWERKTEDDWSLVWQLNYRRKSD